MRNISLLMGIINLGYKDFEDVKLKKKLVKLILKKSCKVRMQINSVLKQRITMIEIIGAARRGINHGDKGRKRVCHGLDKDRQQRPPMLIKIIVMIGKCQQFLIAK